MSGWFDTIQPLIRVLKISFVGIMDFAVGLTLGTLIDRAFTQLLEYQYKKLPVNPNQPLHSPNQPPVLDNGQLKILGLVTLTQLIVTLVTGLELRNLFLPFESFFDPTGGIVFVIALLQQPGLWANSHALLQNLYRALWWLEQPQTEETVQS